MLAAAGNKVFFFRRRLESERDVELRVLKEGLAKTLQQRQRPGPHRVLCL